MTLFLFLAAFVGGALNAVAGGGSFIGLPALILAGVPAVSANATNTLALWPASMASAWAYRREVAATRSWIVSLGGASLAGGIIGGLLLLRTTDDAFLRLLPWLLLLAAVTFSCGGALQRMLARQHPAAIGAQHPPSLAGSSELRRGRPGAKDLTVLLLQFLISIYGGYFGGGMGIMMLATLTIAGMTDIHRMNAVKSVLAVLINGVALVGFIALGVIAWAPGAIMAAGGIAGGYVGAATARRVEERYVLGLVTVVAWGMTVYFFLR